MLGRREGRAVNGSKAPGLADAQKALGRRICELRRKKGWSQESFADICRIHRSHMGEIERGECNVTLETLAVITGKLETTISLLFKAVA